MKKETKKLKGAVLLFENWHGKKDIGSSRIRGHWLVRYWDELEVFKQGEKYDFVIFQKTYWLDYVREYKGIKILDICDPDWLDTTPIVELAGLCDAITTSTQALKEEVEKFTDTPVIFIPDRQDLATHNVQKVHKGKAKMVVWFGYSHNTKAIDPTVLFLKKFGLKLKVISNGRPPYMSADINIKYDWANPEFDFNKEVLEADIVLMPQDTRPRGKFKSKNKTYTAWALGMPVATNPDELEKFMDEDARKKEAKLRLQEMKDKYDVKLSVEDFKRLIKEINDKKNK